MSVVKIKNRKLKVELWAFQEGIYKSILYTEAQLRDNAHTQHSNTVLWLAQLLQNPCNPFMADAIVM